MPKRIFQMWFLIPANAMTPWWWKSALDFMGLTEKEVTVPNYNRDWRPNESDTIFNHWWNKCKCHNRWITESVTMSRMTHVKVAVTIKVPHTHTINTHIQKMSLTARKHSIWSDMLIIMQADNSLVQNQWVYISDCSCYSFFVIAHSV